MPIISSFTHTLAATDNGTRVRLESAALTPINVEIGSALETWPEGAYIEILSRSSGPVTFISYDATLNVYGSTTIAYGEYARVNLVSPGIWDLHVYPHPPTIPFIPAALGDLEDVYLVPAPTSGDSLVFNGVSWVATPIVTGATTLDGLDDVFVEPGDGDVLIYDSGTNQWVSATRASFKPRPLETQVLMGPYDFGSALHHNWHYRSLALTDLYVTVKPDAFWTGTDEWWANGNAPTTPTAMPAGGSALFGKHAAGNVIFIPGPGVVINTPDTLIINKLNGKATLIKVGPNEWDLEGNLASA